MKHGWSSIRAVRKSTRCLPVVLMCGLLSVSSSLAAPDKIGAQTQTKSQVQIECPSHDFPAFLQAFAASVEIQKKFTKFPLAYRYRAGEPTPPGHTPKGVRVVVKNVEIASFAKLPFDKATMAGVLPSEEEQRSVGFERIVEQVKNRSPSQEMVVYFVLPDTDAMLSYYFHKTGECWRLRFIEAQ